VDIELNYSTINVDTERHLYVKFSRKYHNVFNSRM